MALVVGGTKKTKEVFKKKEEEEEEVSWFQREKERERDWMTEKPDRERERERQATSFLFGIFHFISSKRKRKRKEKTWFWFLTFDWYMIYDIFPPFFYLQNQFQIQKNQKWMHAYHPCIHLSAHVDGSGSTRQHHGCMEDAFNKFDFKHQSKKVEEKRKEISIQSSGYDCGDIWMILEESGYDSGRINNLSIID